MIATITGTGNGTAPVVNLTFPYIDQSHVKAAVNGVAVSFTWTSSSQITFSAVVANGAPWKVYRETPTSPPLVDFTDGALLKSADLDLAQTAHTYRDEELSDLISLESSDRDDALASEQTTRAAADTAEAASRAAADAAESASRLAADNLEINARAAAVSAEAVFRAAGDSAERTDRMNADAGLLTALSGVSLSTATLNAFDRTALASLDHTLGLAAVLMESGREGIFKPSSVDHSADVAADPRQGLYVAFASDPTGASGAWVRAQTSPADPRWWGGDGTNGADSKNAIQDGLNLVGHVRLPANSVFRTSGGLIFPSHSRLEGPGTINFDASLGTVWLLAPGADGTAADVSDINIIGVRFISSSDVGFMHLVRLSNTGTIDGFRFNFNTIEYTAVPTNSSDRWGISGAGAGGTRLNMQTIGNHVSGPMQLLGTGIGGHKVQHWDILFNVVKNSRSNAIALVTLGGLTGLNTAEDVTIGWNDIYADSYTAVGIFIGIDGFSTDRFVILRRIKLIGNKINITAAGLGQPDVLVRLGNLTANIGGQDSIAEAMTWEDNTFYGTVQIVQDLPATGSGTSKATNFGMRGNRHFGGDINLAYLADGASFIGNRGVGAALRLSLANGRVDSKANIWRNFNPASSSSEFTFNGDGDTFLGSGQVFETTVNLNPTAGKVQTANLNNCTIESASVSPQTAIGTTGTGTATVNIWNLHTKTAWSGGRYSRGATSGGITDFTGGELFKVTGVDPPSLTAGNAEASERTKTNVYGAQVGDPVLSGFSNDLKGLKINARVSAPGIISYFFENPAGNPNGTQNLASGTVWFRYYSQSA